MQAATDPECGSSNPPSSNCSIVSTLPRTKILNMANTLPAIASSDDIYQHHPDTDDDDDEHDTNFDSQPSNTVSSESLNDIHTFSLQGLQRSYDHAKSATFPRRSSDTSNQELDDEVLFPGWRFGGHSIIDDAKKEGFGFPINQYGIPRQNQKSNLSDTAKDQYEHDVLQKYFKNGMLSTFKGREEMVISEAKVVAHKEIERLHVETHQTEKKLMRLEEELSRARVGGYSLYDNTNLQSAVTQQTSGHSRTSNLKTPKNNQRN